MYDVTSDQRRKIAYQKNTQDLFETSNDLERHRQLLGEIIAILRAGSTETAEPTSCCLDETEPNLPWLDLTLPGCALA